MKTYTFQCPYCGCTELYRETVTTERSVIVGIAEDGFSERTLLAEVEHAAFYCSNCYEKWDDTDDLRSDGALVEKKTNQ